MTWWQVFELSEPPDGTTVPQLLVKPVFSSDSYVIYLTDLSNIWSEKLDLDGIVKRASQEQCPIEVSKQDTSQLAILLENVMNSLSRSNDTARRMSRSQEDGVTLNTTIRLPEPLESLTWRFRLEKTNAGTLKNELILPLLVSSHIQYERINSLVSMIADKDRAITRLVDQYESSHLDLAAAFPVISSLKSGRRAIKREQAARHVPALQPFREAAWRAETEQLEDSDVTTLGLFQQALAQSTSRVPSQLRSDDGDAPWWTLLPDRLSLPRIASKSKPKGPQEVKPKEAGTDSSEDETEDEFETHENFKVSGLSLLLTFDFLIM